MIDRRLFSKRRFKPTQLPGCVLWLDPSQSPLTMAAGQASQFTAANSESLSIADNASLSAGDIDFTVAGWFYLDTEPGTMVMLTKGTADSVAGLEYRLQYTTTNGGRTEFFVSNGTSSNAIADAGSLVTGQWYFVCASHDSVLNQLTLTLNATASTPIALTTGSQDTAGALTLGASSGATNFFDGRLQCWGLWKSALTAAQITTLYNGGVPLSYDQVLNAGLGNQVSLVSYWELNEPSGTRSDLHGTNHLTDNNTVTTAAGTCLNAVGQINDLSGRGNHASQSTQASKPMLRSYQNGLGRRCLQFDGTDDTLVVDSLATYITGTDVPHTVIAVVQSLASANQFYVSWGNSGVGTQFGGLQDDTTNFRHRKIDDAAATGQINDGSRNGNSHIIGIADSGTAGTLFLDASQATGSTDVGAFTLDKARIGSFGRTSDTNFLNGKIGEVAAWNRMLTTQEMRKVIVNWGRKWGVAV